MKSEGAAPAPHEDTVRLLRRVAETAQNVVSGKPNGNPVALLENIAADCARHADLLAQPPVRSEEEADAWLLLSWTGQGTTPVFRTKKAAERFLSEYPSDALLRDSLHHPHGPWEIVPVYRQAPLPQEGPTREQIEAAVLKAWPVTKLQAEDITDAVLALFPKVTP